MSKKEPRIGVWQGAIVWHVDEVGTFHWGSPDAREEAVRREAAHRERARKQKLLRERLTAPAIGSIRTHRSNRGR